MVGAVPTVLLAFSFVFALAAALNWQPTPRINSLGAAFAFLVAALLLGGPLQYLLSR